MNNFKKAFIFGFMGWLALAGFSVAEYPGILNKTCYWQLSFLFCSPQLGVTQKIILFLIFFLVSVFFTIYGLITWRLITSGNDIKLGKWPSVALIAGSLMLAAMVVAIGSGDMDYYYNSSKAMVAGKNIYAQDWTLINEMSYSSEELPQKGFSYGPVTASLFKVVYKLSHNINVFVIIWKSVVILFLCLCAWLVVKLAKSYNLAFKEKDLYLFWFLQPLLLFEVVVNGHFDLIWLFFVLATLWLVRRKYWFLAIPCFAIGIWIKFIPLLVAPWFVLWWWQETNKSNWLKQVAQLISGLLLGAILTTLFWAPYWTGWSSFKSLAVQSKWVVSSLFGLVYYSLSPLFKWFLADQAHWYLTRLVHFALLVVAIYFLYPYLKKVILVLLKREHWDDFDFYQAMFISLLVYLFIWQKSFWPWYIIWLMPIGLLLYLKHRNIFLRRILVWISLAPLIIYPVSFFVWQMSGVYATDYLWFYYFYVPVVSAYPLFNIIKWRKTGYQAKIIL